MIDSSSRLPRRSARIAPARRRATPALITVLALAVTLSGCGAAPGSGDGASAPSVTGASPGTTAPMNPTEAAEPSTAVPTPATPPAADAQSALSVGVVPATLTVPAMGLTENLIPLGIQADGTMEVPVDYDDVGYFTGGGQPGGIGPTVIAGHVDSRSGPAVFFRLGEMVIGDRFALTGIDGSEFEYEVYKIEDHAKAAFPTMNVFGATTTDEVRLITCGGEYDQSIGRYVDNLVVFATRV